MAALAAGELFCGPIEDEAVVRGDHERAKRYLVMDHYRLEAIKCLRGQAAWLVRTSSGQRGIRRVAEALLERGTLTGEDVRAICDDPRDTRAADWVVKPNPRRDGS